MTERDHLTNCGIYKITSPTNKIYIGQSVNIRKRWGYYRQPHATSLKTILGRSLAKYGWRSHVFEVLIECPPEHLNEMEIKYIEMFKTFNTRHGMNAKGGGESGRMSESAKQKLSVPKSEETKQKFSIAARNRPPITEETRKKHSEARKGRKCKPSTIELKRIISTGKFHTEETKQKISRTKTGVKFSEETKKRLRDKWTCRQCGRGDIELQIHHKDYFPGIEPWDYPDTDLITLCKRCHSKENKREKHETMLLISLKSAGFTAFEILALSTYLDMYEGFRSRLKAMIDNSIKSEL